MGSVPSVPVFRRNPGYNSANNRYSQIGASYDASGNLLYDTFNTYTWDGYEKVASVNPGQSTASCGTSGWCLTYDALGRMVELNASGIYSQVLYSPIGKTAIMNGQTVSKVWYPMPGGGTVLASSTNWPHYQHKDWLGSGRLQTEWSGTLGNSARTVDYDRSFAPYGEMYGSTGNDAYDLDFTGDVKTMWSSGLLDTPNRELHPNQGRWISPDPAHSGWNQYAYSTNPNSQVDPSGLLVYAPYGGSETSVCGGGWGEVCNGPLFDEFDLLERAAAVEPYVVVPLVDVAYVPPSIYVDDQTNAYQMPGYWSYTLDPAHAFLYYPDSSGFTDIQNIVSVTAPTNNRKKSLLNCTINTANKLTITNGLAQIPGVGSLIPEGSWARAGVDLVGGGNAISGLLAAGQTVFGNSASRSELAQTGAGIILDPSMGLGPALEAGGINVPSALGALTDTVAEGASGLGLIKLGVDFALTLGSGAYCAVTQ